MSKVVLRPGILVAFSTRVEGGVTYSRKDLDEGVDNAGQEVSRWETERVITDPAEYEAATKARSKCRSLVTKACSQTSFGLLCPEEREGELDAALEAAREVAAAFNAGASYSRIHVYVLKGRIAESDAEASRALASEVRGLLDQMSEGIRSMNPAAIRDAADRAKKLEAVLGEGQAAAVERAVDFARRAAKEIVRRVEKGGEKPELVLEEIATRPIEAARFAFLDIEDEPQVPASEAPVIDQRFAELEAS